MKLSTWTLSPYYMIALGLSVPAAASQFDGLAGQRILLASFDTELHKPAVSSSSRAKSKPAANTSTEPKTLTEAKADIRLRMKEAASLIAAGKHAEFIQAMTEIEQLASGIPALTGDIAALWIKHGRSDRAASYLEKSKPLNAPLAVQYGWALRYARQDEKLTRLLTEIDAGKLGKPFGDVQLQAQLADIRKYHAAHLDENLAEPNQAQIFASSAQDAALPEKDVVANRRSSREKYDPFAALGISHADIFFSQRSKTGESGTSRLIARKEPGFGYGWRSAEGSTDYRVQVDRVTLNSGLLDPALAIVGSDGAYPLANGVLPAIPAPRIMSMSGFEPLLIARHDEAGAIYTGEIGMTPTGGAVSSTITGRVNALKYASWGNTAIDAYIQPVRDSLLSYTGMNDPYAAKTPWGRVIKTGITPSVYWQFNNKWSASSSALLEGLTGVNTRNNSHYGARLGLGYSLDVKKFEYLTVDFSGTYDHYQNNQNLYTFGNGGYYSPQTSVNIGPSINFLTRNFHPLVIQGRAYAGYGKASNAEAMRFPLDPANPLNAPALPGAAGFYSGNSKGTNYNFSLQALWNVQKDLQLGCAVAYSQSDASAPAFKENNLSFFARIPFDGIIK